MSATKLMDLMAQRDHSIPMLMVAFVTLHGLGLFACAVALTVRVEEPYQMRDGGLMLAWVVSCTIMPAALTGATWAAMLIANNVG
jgi:hypothetical protein